MATGRTRNPASQGYQAVRDTSASLEWLTRIGFFAKGVVYVLIGVLALMAAFGEGGETTDQQGIIRRIAGQPFGEFALIVIGVGLLAYALWRFVSAASDTEGEGSDAKGIAKRIGYAISGFVYAGIGVSALRIVMGNGGGQGGNSTQTWTARLMEAPAGQFLVILAGIAVIIVGIMQIRHGWKEKFVEKLYNAREWVVRLGKWGYIARGVVFGVIGALLVTAGMQSDASEAKGLEGSLDTLASQPYGQWLLAFVAAGLICYGAFTMAEAKYRAIRH